MPLPVQPQPYDVLIERFPYAIQRRWALDELVLGGQTSSDRPGVKREHVFDTEDGLRLIISREVQTDGRDYIHVSMSHWDAEQVLREYKIDRHGPMEQFFAVALVAFKRVAGLTEKNVGYAHAEWTGPNMDIANLFFPLGEIVES